MNSQPTSLGHCKDCRYWKPASETVGTCFAAPPSFRNDEGMGEWPMTKADAGCGRFAGPPKGITYHEKVSSAKIVELVRENNKPGPNGERRVYFRRYLIADLMKLGLAKSSAVDRIKTLSARGVIVVHRGVPFPGYDPECMVTLPDAEVIDYRTPPRTQGSGGRPKMDPTLYLDRLHEAAPTPDTALNMSEVTRLFTPITRPTAYRIIGELVNAGLVQRTASGLYCAPAAGPATAEAEKGVSLEFED